MIYLRLLALSFMLISSHAYAGILSSFTRSLPRFATTARTHFFNTKILTPTSVLGFFSTKKESPKNSIADEMKQLAESRGLTCWAAYDTPCSNAEQETAFKCIQQNMHASKKYLEDQGVDTDEARIDARRTFVPLHRKSIDQKRLFVHPSEAPHTYALVSKIAQKLGHATPAIVFEYAVNGTSSRGTHHLTLYYDYFLALTPEEQEALIGHEEGHKALGHLPRKSFHPQENQKQELEADQKAAEIMQSAAPVISMYKKILRPCAPYGRLLSDTEIAEIENSRSHPCPETRIKHLEMWEKARQSALKK